MLEGIDVVVVVTFCVVVIVVVTLLFILRGGGTVFLFIYSIPTLLFCYWYIVVVTMNVVVPIVVVVVGGGGYHYPLPLFYYSVVIVLLLLLLLHCYLWLLFIVVVVVVVVVICCCPFIVLVILVCWCVNCYHSVVIHCYSVLIHCCCCVICYSVIRVIVDTFCSVVVVIPLYTLRYNCCYSLLLFCCCCWYIVDTLHCCYHLLFIPLLLYLHWYHLRLIYVVTVTLFVVCCCYSLNYLYYPRYTLITTVMITMLHCCCCCLYVVVCCYIVVCCWFTLFYFVTIYDCAPVPFCSFIDVLLLLLIHCWWYCCCCCCIVDVVLLLFMIHCCCYYYLLMMLFIYLFTVSVCIYMRLRCSTFTFTLRDCLPPLHTLLEVFVTLITHFVVRCCCYTPFCCCTMLPDCTVRYVHVVVHLRCIHDCCLFCSLNYCRYVVPALRCVVPRFCALRYTLPLRYSDAVVTLLLRICSHVDYVTFARCYIVCHIVHARLPFILLYHCVPQIAVAYVYGLPVVTVPVAVCVDSPFGAHPFVAVRYVAIAHALRRSRWLHAPWFCCGLRVLPHAFRLCRCPRLCVISIMHPHTLGYVRHAAFVYVAQLRALRCCVVTFALRVCVALQFPALPVLLPLRCGGLVYLLLRYIGVAVTPSCICCCLYLVPFILFVVRYGVCYIVGVLHCSTFYPYVVVVVLTVLLYTITTLLLFVDCTLYMIHFVVLLFICCWLRCCDVVVVVTLLLLMQLLRCHCLRVYCTFILFCTLLFIYVVVTGYWILYRWLRLRLLYIVVTHTTTRFCVACLRSFTTVTRCCVYTTLLLTRLITHYRCVCSAVQYCGDLICYMVLPLRCSALNFALRFVALRLFHCWILRTTFITLLFCSVTLDYAILLNFVVVCLFVRFTLVYCCSFLHFVVDGVRCSRYCYVTLRCCCCCYDRYLLLLLFLLHFVDTLFCSCCCCCYFICHWFCPFVLCCFIIIIIILYYYLLLLLFIY